MILGQITVGLAIVVAGDWCGTRSTPPCSLVEDPQASSDGSRPDPDASDAIYSAPPCALAVTMLREPGADLETERWSGREKAAVDNDFRARHERGFVPTAFATSLGSPGRWLLAQSRKSA